MLRERGVAIGAEYRYSGSEFCGTGASAARPYIGESETATVGPIGIAAREARASLGAATETHR
jgi:hypothetical protein